MTRRLTIVWHLRQLMAERGMYNTSDIVGPLAERGVKLSREQVYRLVTQTPQRLNVEVLAALCDILSCGPQDLLEVAVDAKQVRKAVAGAGESGGPPSIRHVKPTPARIRRPEDGR
jgi:DNA-binding Xre family transcriptional regulator